MRPHSGPSAGAGDSVLQPLKWRQLNPSGSQRPGPRSGAASVIFNDALYILGGYGGNGRLDDAWRYSFSAESWFKLVLRGPSPPSRENNGSVLFKGKFYIFGGYSGQVWLNDFHSLDLTTLEWKTIDAENPPAPRFGYVSAVWEDRMVLYGGYDGTNWLSDMYEFYFKDKKWIQLHDVPGIPAARSCPSWVIYHESGFLFGGYDGVNRMNDFHEYNFATKVWRPVLVTGPGPSARYFHSAVVYGDLLYLFGGYTGSERLQDLYQFSFHKKSWSRFDSENAPSGRSSLVAQAYGNSLYIFGGYNGTSVLNDFYEFRFELIAIPQSTLVQDLKMMINDPVLSDLVLLIEEREMYVNKALLAVRSEYFKDKLFGGPDVSRLEIEGFSYPVIEILIEYIYTDEVPPLTVQMTGALLMAADVFMIERLKSLCSDAIRQNLSVENVVEMLRIAHYHNAEHLKEVCVEFICTKHEEVKCTQSFRQLVDEPKLLMELIMRLK